MPYEPQHWKRALTLLDVALAMPSEPRSEWLAELGRSEPAVCPLVKQLLSSHERVESHDLLVTMPKVLRVAPRFESGAAGMVVGSFELVEPIGRGGMASVWRARYSDGRLKRDVAVKLPATSGSPEALTLLRERFMRERDFLAQLEHPNIARLYDAGVSDAGQPFLAMEYVAGQPIDAYCEAQRLPIKARIQLFLQVLDAVVYAHQQLVLHRDLKPSNVLVDEQQQVRLLDFGIARMLPPPDSGAAAGQAETDLTERAGAAFTLSYAAPEQVHRGPLSTATDVYALGVMLHLLLTGLSPYQPERDTRGGLEDAVLLATPQAPSSRTFAAAALQTRQCTAVGLSKALSGDLDVIIGKALKKLASERYASVVSLAEDLKRHLAQQPIAARPDSWRYRAALFVARNRTAVFGSGAAVAALATATGVAVWQAQVSRHNAERAERESGRAHSAQQFFADLVSSADPEKNKLIPTNDRRLIIDHALITAEQRFAKDPQTLAMVLKQLGDIYFRLGASTKVLEVRQKHFAIVQSIATTTANERVDAQLALGEAYGYSAKPEELAQALPNLLAAYEMAAKSDASPELLVKALCLIADGYRIDSKPREAYRYAELAVQKAEQSLPNPHEHLAWAYETRGTAAAALRSFDVALSSLRKAMEVDATGRARGKVDQLNGRSNLANTEFAAGHYGASKREALSALEFARRELGAMDGTLTSMKVRAVLAAERGGELDEANRLATQLLREDLESSDGMRAGRAHYATGVVASARGEYAAAAKAYAAAELRLGLHKAWGPALTVHQATLHLRTGDPAAAYRLLAPLLEQMRIENRVSTEFGRAAERAAVALMRQKRAEPARALFKEACEWNRERLKPEHPDRVRCEAYLLLSSEAAPALRQRGLAQQQAMVRTSTDPRSGLALSLQASTAWLGSGSIESGRTEDFPLLN